MAAHQRGCLISNKRNRAAVALVVVVVTQLMSVFVATLYLPNDARYNSIASRRQDYDDIEDMDHMDQGASTPYQNKGGPSGGGGGDGYEDNEPDGPYDETPRDEEGQADMERFFEDHLGASERDGMDKENLPSNSILTVALSPQQLSDKCNGKILNSIGALNDHQVAGSHARATKTLPHNRIPNASTVQYLKHTEILPNVRTKYLKLPNKPLIITRQITEDNIEDDESSDLSQAPSARRTKKRKNSRPRSQVANPGEDVVATEDEDMDKVYVTRLTNKPFKIDALGGFDPEEDFQDASRDIEDINKFDETREKKRAPKESARESARNPDITFNDPEADSLFNDASEKDEVAQGEPYQTDLESEIEGQSLVEPDSKSSPALDSVDTASTADNEIKPRISGSADDSEGSWVNDGVDDMEIPSQSHQDAVLEKAEEVPNRYPNDAVTNDDVQQQQQQQSPEEVEPKAQLADSSNRRI